MKPLFFLVTLSMVLLFISCENNQSEKDIALNTADTASITGLTSDSVKLVKTAGIRFKVKDVSQSIRAVSELAQSLGGMIIHQNMESTEDQSKELKVSDDSLLRITAYTTYATITARVPASHLEEFLYNTSSLGYYTSGSKMDIDDKSLDYLSNQLKQQNRAQAFNSGNKGKGAAATFLAIQTQDEAIDQEIANRQIDADVKYSTVQLSLYQNTMVRKELIANNVVEDYHLSFPQNFSNALREGWDGFLRFILMLAHLWVFILLAVLSWVLYKSTSLKRKAGLVKESV